MLLPPSDVSLSCPLLLFLALDGGVWESARDMSRLEDDDKFMFWKNRLRKQIRFSEDIYIFYYIFLFSNNCSLTTIFLPSKTAKQEKKTFKYKK